MFELNVMENILPQYQEWITQQHILDIKYFNGRLNSREYLIASLELLVQYMPKGEGLKSHSGWYK